MLTKACLLLLCLSAVSGPMRGLNHNDLHREDVFDAYEEHEALFDTDLKASIFYDYSGETYDPYDEPFYARGARFEFVDGTSMDFNQNEDMYGLMNLGDTWNSYRGEGVKVAVLDCGIRYDHHAFQKDGQCILSDLSAEITTSSSGDIIINKVSDYGFDVIQEDPSVVQHATSVAATICEVIDDYDGVGLAPNSELIMLTLRNLTFSEIYYGIEYALSVGADIISMSLGAAIGPYTDYDGELKQGMSDEDLAALEELFDPLFQRCNEEGAVVVASSGNYGTETYCYPSTNERVISVGALAESSSTQIASYSSTGKVDVVAPGTVLVPLMYYNYDEYGNLIVDENGDYTFDEYYFGLQDGTSFACPLTSASIALYLSKYPGSTVEEVKAALFGSAYDLGDAGKDSVFGYGRVDITEFLADIPLEGIAFANDHINVPSSTTSYDLSVDLYPNNATNAAVTYSIKDYYTGGVPGFAFIDSSTGLLTITGKGKLVVEAVSNDGGYMARTIFVIGEVGITLDQNYTGLEVPFRGDAPVAGNLLLETLDGVEMGYIDPSLETVSVSGIDVTKIGVGAASISYRTWNFATNVKVTFKGASDFTGAAIAYYDYFMDITGKQCAVSVTGSPFDESIWTELANEYGYLPSNVRNDLANNDTYLSMHERYGLIVSKYSLSDFMGLYNEGYRGTNYNPLSVGDMVIASLLLSSLAFGVSLVTILKHRRKKRH